MFSWLTWNKFILGTEEQIMPLNWDKKFVRRFLQMLKKIILDKKFYTLSFISCLIFLAGIFRFYNLNWDLGNYFHPDERNIANAVSQIYFFSQLNPHFFAYGVFPFIFIV